MVTSTPTRDLHKADSISARVDEVARDVSRQLHSRNPELVQACLMECAALSQQWRAAVTYFDAAIIENHQDFDYRNLRDILLPAVQKTKRILQDVAKVASDLPARDLQTRLSEIERIIERFENWPTNDPTVRNAARAAIATEKSLTDEELAALFSP